VVHLAIRGLVFGIGKIAAENGSHTNTTRSIGTPLYMAPEQFRPGSKVFPATDIYSLGMLAFTLLVGAPYWDEEQQACDNVFSFVATVMHGPKETATARAARRGVVLPGAFDTFFAKVTALAPGNRYASATVAIAALAEALGLPMPGDSARNGKLAATVEVSPMGAVEGSGVAMTQPVPKPKWTNPIAAGIVMALVLVGAGAVVVFVRTNAHTAAQRTRGASDTPPLPDVPAKPIEVPKTPPPLPVEPPPTPIPSANTPMAPSATPARPQRNASTAPSTQKASPQPPKPIDLVGRN